MDAVNDDDDAEDSYKSKCSLLTLEISLLCENGRKTVKLRAEDVVEDFFASLNPSEISAGLIPTCGYQHESFLLEPLKLCSLCQMGLDLLQLILYCKFPCKFPV